jgi:hypothetical protein
MEALGIAGVTATGTTGPLLLLLSGGAALLVGSGHSGLQDPYSHYVRPELQAMRPLVDTDDI